MPRHLVRDALLSVADDTGLRVSELVAMKAECSWRSHVCGLCGRRDD